MSSHEPASERRDAASGAEHPDGSRLRDDRGPRDGRRHGRARGPDVRLLLPGLPRALPSRPRRVRRPAGGRGRRLHRPGPRRRRPPGRWSCVRWLRRVRVDLSDAPRGASTRPRRLPRVRDGPRAGDDRHARRPHRVHVPDASPDRARGAGGLPHLRHGPRAPDGHAGGAGQPGAGGHVAAVLDRAHPDGAAPGPHALERPPR